ncbi:hypothetical protein POM88_036227 [Heracleum sosnowskyi]|uniref:Helicase ATP-binding domain-containing protein n=1 Tax=Heracleum sosnowskyi TaxID=360622 RepID=A0AAD8HQ39_9APIA|nr:hypothetical protein POM88_036227 [Heracleum sosnowskyi]
MLFSSSVMMDHRMLSLFSTLGGPTGSPGTPVILPLAHTVKHEKSDLDVVQDDEEDEYSDLADEHGSGAMQMGGAIIDDEGVVSNEGMTLDVQDIDAYWLKRKISQAYEQQTDPQLSQKLAEEVLKIVAEGDDREVQTKLLVHLQCDKFSLIKRAEDQEEREKVEEEITQFGPELGAILEQLHATRATAKERQKNLEKSSREEARRLKDERGGDGDRGRRGISDRDAESGWLNGQLELLDLESLAFNQGGLMMGIRKCELPLGSYRNHNKGCEEVHVPAPKPKPLAEGEKLIKISAMPDWARPAFEGMSQLNRVQTRVYDTTLFSAENLLLLALTGAGKTNVAMLTILKQIALNRNEDSSFNHSNYKIVYVAPMKALVAEVVGNLFNRLKQFEVNEKELSGDQTLTHQQIEETHIIIRTPEKWDFVTRKSGDRTYTQLEKLLIIDEIHLLHDNRGPVLENIVARTVRQIETTKEHIRLVGLSATLPDYEDVALFLRVDLTKETAKTARAIRALANDTVSRLIKEESASREILSAHTELVRSNDLKDLFPYGFAVHHAGKNGADRQLVQKLFGDAYVQVLVSTAILAWGVNLPAHAVITIDAWSGRPQYDTYGERKIITGHSELQIPKKPAIGLAIRRMIHNSSLYGLAPDALRKNFLLEERRVDLTKRQKILEQMHLHEVTLHLAYARASFL